MKNHLSQITLFGLVAVMLAAVPAASHAEDKPTTPAPGGGHMREAFHGRVTAVDTAAMTLTVEDKTLTVTSQTLISRENKPAVLAEILVGDTANGAYKTDAAGKLNATSIRAEKEKKKERNKTTEAAPVPTPAPAPGN